MRTANLYHILPRPDDKVWDGIEYFDPVSKKGAIYIFRPDNPESRQVVKLKGLDAKAKYWLWGEDSSIALQQASGEELMQRGLAITLPQIFSSDIIFLQEVSLGKPVDLLEPDEFKLISAKPKSEPFTITAELAWEPSKNARSYRVSVSDTAEFTNTLAMATTATSSIVLSRLPPARKLYWKVEAVSPAGKRLNTGGPGTFITPESHFQGCDVCIRLAVDEGHGRSRTNRASRRELSRENLLPSMENAIPKGCGRTRSTTRRRPISCSTFPARTTRRSRRPSALTTWVNVVACNSRFSWMECMKAESPVMLPKKTHELSVDVKQGKKVTLRVLNGGDGYGWDHAVWGFARFIKTNVKDTLESDQ